MAQKIEIDGSFKDCLSLLYDSDQNLFITGNAGTGKSTLLSLFISKTKQNVVVLAPTGVAALNIGGATIHSFFRFSPGITKEEAAKIGKRQAGKDSIYSNIEMIIIDEISMVRADLLDCVDVFLKAALEKKDPFGGIRVIFIGDLYQLPPVLSSKEKEAYLKLYPSPYFFSSSVMQEKSFKLRLIELDKIYRQKDAAFISILNGIRKKTVTDEDLFLLNQRVEKIPKESTVYLTATNNSAEKINEEKLKDLPGKTFTYEAELDDNFEKENMPAERLLKLKKGAQVMLLSNHPQGLWVNGTIGEIENLNADEIQVKLPYAIVTIEKYTWNLYRYAFEPSQKKLVQEKLGSFSQYPLKLAWAMTIHKSQGKTFDSVVIDLEKGAFAHGQTYVALSRCRTLDKLYLKKPIKKSHLIMDYKVIQFLTSFQYKLASQDLSIEEKKDLIEKAILTKTKLAITYLKTTDEKSKRTILPLAIEEKQYNGRSFTGLSAFCFTRNEERTFKIERILELKEIID